MDVGASVLCTNATLSTHDFDSHSCVGFRTRTSNSKLCRTPFVMSDSDSESDNELIHVATMACTSLQHILMCSRRFAERRMKFRPRRFLSRRRITIAMLKSTWHVNQFKETLGMDEGVFYRLVRILKPFLPVVSITRSPNGLIPCDAKVAIALCFLRGGAPVHICNMFGVGLSTVMSVVYEVVNSVNKAFAIKFPEDHREQTRIALGFQKRSSIGFNCVAGCVDGLIIWTEQPHKRECEKMKCGAKKFYCERKAKFGLNMQGLCDDDGKFLEVWIGNPASSSDFMSFIRSSMYRKLATPGFLKDGT